jgi:antitoxin component YwqK of YwqJK toxin-antitoxin module
MKYSYYLSIAVLFFIIACHKKSEVVESRWPNGSPKIVKVYEGSGKSKKLVKEIGYYQNKKKYVEGEVKGDSIKDGKWTVWYENGNIWSEGYFKNNKPEGLRIVYYENGKVRYKGKFKDGKPVGTWSFWDEKGTLVNKHQY